MKMNPSHDPDKAGSVLLVTLLVTGLMTMVVLALSTHVRLELRQVSARMDHQMARNNARLGLELALSQLQVAAGPDQRATATAGIFGDDIPVQNRPVSGVWNTAEPDDPPTWLISGINFDPASSIPANQTVLLSALQPDGTPPTLASAVPAPLMNVYHPVQAHQQGAFAFWVSDEGVKASVAPIFQADAVLNQSALAEQRFERLVRQRSSVSSGRPDFIPEEGLLSANSMGLNLSRRNDLPLAWSSSNEEQRFVASRLKDTFHHFTGRSYGLLTNPVDGGFRHDLSSIPRLTPLLSAGNHAWINPAVLEGLSLWTEASSGPLKPRVIRGSNQPDDPTLKLTPVITELFLGTAISGNAANAAAEEVFIYYLLFAELWNPFTLPLDFSRRDIYDDIILRVSGLPTVELTNQTRGISETITIPPLVMDLDFYDFIDGSETEAFEPGRMTWTGNPRSSGGGSEVVEGITHLRRNGVYIIDVPIGRIAGTTVEDFVGVFSASDVRFDFYLKRSAFDDPSDPHIHFWTLELNGFEEFEIEYVGGDGTPSSYTGSPSQFFRPRNTAPHGVNRASINQSRNSFNYWMRINEDLFSPGNDDFRDLMLTNALQRSRTSINVSSPSGILNNLYDVAEFPEQKARNSAFSALDFFSARDSAIDVNHDRWAFVFDLPTRPPVELAQLNFLVFSEESFEKLGHPNTSNLNSLYDRYFMSGLEEDTLSPPEIGSLTPNPRYRVMDTASFNDFETWAGDLLMVGAFNVNSTSELAWAEVLTGSDLIDWPFGSETPVSQTDLQSAWFTLPDFGSRMFNRVFSGTDNFAAPLRNNGTGFRAFSNFVISNLSRDTAVAPAFRQGFREIEDTTRRRLGREISSRVASHGRPFFSMQEFFDSGIIQDAIDAIPELNTDGAGNPIPGFSPGYFSQMSLANNLGSRLNSRSDTFQIIAYGHIENSLTGERIEAKAKAMVQRVPKREFPGGPPSLTEREFIILEFQWLN
jgi:hypothetical protein